MVGSLHNFKDKPSRETMELLEDSTLISIPLKQLKPLMQSNTEVANWVNAILEEYTLFLEDKLNYTQLMSGMEKYRTLVEQEPRLFQRIPLTYLASFLGITRETLSRLRAK
jgi:CRP-like cAMP-binding protein